MRFALLMLVGVAVLGLVAAPASAGCDVCEKVKKTGEGFCDHCKSGEAFGLKLTSKILFEALTGTTGLFDQVKKSECKECQEVAQHGGACAACNVYVDDGRASHSWAGHVLAQGKPIHDPKLADKIQSCEHCKKYAEQGGFCTDCKVGFVAKRAFQDETAYNDARIAMKVAAKAIANDKCESCAVAQLTDGTCDKCKVTFKRGKAGQDGFDPDALKFRTKTLRP